MGVIQLVTTFENVSGLPEDRFQNVVHVAKATEPTGAEALTLAQTWEDFYNNAYAGMNVQVSSYISGVAQRGAGISSIAAYYSDDLSGQTPMGSPIATNTFSLGTNASGDDLPEEVAAVISYNGDLTDVPVSQVNPNPPPATIRPQSRRRGRLFVGPLEQTAGATVGGAFRPAAQFRTDATIAFKETAEAINAISGLTFVIWSRADEALYAAVAGYMDDAWDTQRRRGPDASTRTSFAIV